MRAPALLLARLLPALLLLLLLLLLPALPRANEVPHEVRQVETITKSVNGSGYYCRGCAAMVVAVHEHILATRHKWSEPGFTVQVREFLNGYASIENGAPSVSTLSASTLF